jgi:hypothetical protein
MGLSQGPSNAIQTSVRIEYHFVANATRTIADYACPVTKTLATQKFKSSYLRDCCTDVSTDEPVTSYPVAPIIHALSFGLYSVQIPLRLVILSFKANNGWNPTCKGNSWGVMPGV